MSEGTRRPSGNVRIIMAAWRMWAMTNSAYIVITKQSTTKLDVFDGPAQCDCDDAEGLLYI